MGLVGFAALLAASAALAGCAEGVPEGSVRLAHWDSEPGGDGFREVFRVAAAPPGVLPEGITVTVDGTVVAASWEDGDGRAALGAGDRLVFDLRGSDARHDLRLVADGKLLARLEFGSGAGTPVEDA